MTLEQFSIQLGKLKYSNIFEKMCYKYFRGYPKKRLEMIKNWKPLIVTVENVILWGFFPGINRLVRQMEYFEQQYCLSMTKNKQYISWFARRRIPVDPLLYMHIQNFDEQQYNGVDLNDFFDNCHSLEGLQKFWSTRTDIDKFFNTPNFTSWPTFNMLKKLIPQVIAIVFLVRIDRSKKNTRKTVDYMELVFGSLCCLCNGVEIYLPNKCHKQYIPRFTELDEPGFLLHLNKLKKILRINACSQSHNQGVKTVQNAMEYYYNKGVPGKVIMDFIQNFGKGKSQNPLERVIY